MIRRFFRIFVPSKWRQALRRNMNILMRRFKAPRMIFGYVDSTGEFRSRTRISDTVFFYHPERIKIGDNVFVWHYTILDGTGGLVIDEGCQIGAWVGIFTHSSHIAIRLYGRHYQEVPEDLKNGYVIDSVTLGRYSFIGAGSQIFPGVKIGKGALVSAGSFVKKNIDDYSIVSGNPAEIIGDTRRLDKRFLRDQAILAWYEEWQKV